MGRKNNRQPPSEEELLLQSLAGPRSSSNKQARSEESTEPPPEKSDQSRYSSTSKRGKKNTNRGRVDIIRQTAHRGGKGVTVVKNFTGIGLPEKQALAKKMQKACGVGGTVKDGCIEIQVKFSQNLLIVLAGFAGQFKLEWRCHGDRAVVAIDHRNCGDEPRHGIGVIGGCSDGARKEVIGI